MKKIQNENEKINEPEEVNPVNYKLEFSGTGKEYFKIWIVNLLLSIVTLGIYSAWAKVIRNQYFYRNLKLDNSGFDYHGKPIAILKGRLIAVALIVALNASQMINAYAYAAMAIVFAIFLPWLISRSLMFQMHNSSWRGIRFSFRESAVNTAKVIYGYGFISAITLGFAFPLQYKKLKTFLFNGTFFGKSQIQLNLKTGNVYKVFLKTIGVTFLAIIILLSPGLFSGSFQSLIKSGNIKPEDPILLFLPVIFMIVYFVFILMYFGYFSARMTNLIWSNVRLEGIKFKSSLKARKLIVIWIKNILLTIITLGLYWPWAVIRLTKYRMESLEFNSTMDLGSFEANDDKEYNAAGEEVTDAFDFDFSF